MGREKILINGLETSFKIEKTGATRNFLILHGWGSKAERWEGVGETIAKNNFNVIVPDLPGFGESLEAGKSWDLDDYCNFVEEFVKKLRLEKIYLLGHSFGGSLAVKFALKFPDRIEKLFLVGAACIRRKSFCKSLSAKLAKIFKIFSFLPFYPSTRRFIYRYVLRSDYINTEGVMRKSYLKVISEDLTNDLAGIEVPTIIIWGQNDNVTPLRDAYIISAQIANSKLIIIPQGKHDLERKMPGILGRKIIENVNA